jgi:glycosyltransferase involved in cell wall biosynthesis
MDDSLPTPRRPSPLPDVSIDVSIIVPARNEEANIGACLQSLTTQTGVAFEIIVVDDGSTDRTREIVDSFAGVRVISPTPPPRDVAGRTWIGKNNAVVAGAKEARAPWLLFTDADTVHLHGSLARALDEAKQQHADLLSYSPEQVVGSFAERAVMPVVFAELAAKYPPEKVRDQNSRIVAANGQYILVRRSAYDLVGGHASIVAEILEDVALARLFRNADLRVYFRYGGDAVRTRMYHNWAQLREGWTKNLALLFPNPARVAAQGLFQWVIAWFAIYVATLGIITRHFLWCFAAALWLLVYRRIRIAHFNIVNNLIAIACGLPLFAYLLLRSKRAHENGKVSWKGRDYDVGAKSESSFSKTKVLKTIRTVEVQGRRAGS